MEDLKNLNLTNEDFKLLIDGLDNLPNRGEFGIMMADMLIHALPKKDDNKRFLMEQELDKKAKIRKNEREILTENIRILQGKLLLFKRYLKENNLLED